MRVGERDGRGEGAEDNIPQLDAMGRNNIAESEVMLAEELGEVVQQDQKEAKSPLIKVSSGWLKVALAKERGKEVEERD